MSVRSEILEQLKQVAHEQDKRLRPLCDELPLLVVARGSWLVPRGS